MASLTRLHRSEPTPHPTDDDRGTDGAPRARGRDLTAARASADQLTEWFDLTERRLPALAKRKKWPIRFDHCFQRVLLDNAVQGCWYDHFEKPAWKHAPPEILARAILVGQRAEAGRERMHLMNDQSLVWRGKNGATHG
jgi:hypothetical protein